MELEYLATMENKSGMTGPEFLREKPGVGFLYLIVNCLATFSGTIGNSLVIAAVLSNKHLKTVSNVFIVNLAVADLCVTAFVDPFSIVGLLKGEMWFDDQPALCELVARVCFASCFCSLLNIGCISFNRYIHICHNSLYNTIYTWKKSIAMCLVLWVIGLLLEISSFFGWGSHGYDRKSLVCLWDRTADFSYTVVIVTVGVAFPIILISICYIKIYQHVRQSKNKIFALQKNSKSTASEAAMSKERRESMKLARTLFVIFAVFVVCWTPYAIIVVADVNDTYPMELHVIVILFAHTNSSLNSIFYGLTNRHFRRSYYTLLHVEWFLKVFGCSKCTLPRRVDGNSSVTEAGVSRMHRPTQEP